MSRIFSYSAKKLLLIGLLCASPCVFAAISDCSAPLPMSINLPSVNVPANLAVGQPIPGARASFAIPVQCSVNPGADWYITVTPTTAVTLVEGYSDVYTISGMGAGIGFRMRNASGAVMAPLTYIGTVNTFDLGAAQIGANLLQGSFELVKTGTTNVGTFGFSVFAHAPGKEYANAGTLTASKINFNYTVIANSVPSCSVVTPDIATMLPTISVSAFQSVGVTAGTAPLNLALQCDSNAKPAISLTDSTTPSNQTNTLTLAPGSSAQGIGVQILYQMTPMSFGPATYSYTNSNTPSVSNVSLGTRSGTQNVPFLARYVQTGTAVTAGTVRTIATFTMNYN